MSKEIRETLVFVNTIPSGRFQVLQRAVHTYFLPQTKIVLPKTSTEGNKRNRINILCSL